MRVAVYVSHVDDGVLGAGGLIPQMVEAGHDVHIIYGNDGYVPQRDHDTRPEAERIAEILGIGRSNIHFLEFSDGRFDDYSLRDFNSRFYELSLEPDVIITHSKNDFHPDHRVIHDSALTVGRSIEKRVGILACEILSSSEYARPSFDPAFYVDIEGYVDQKITALKQVESEIREWPHPRSEEGIRVKTRQRGMEVGLDYAEAFEVIRWFDWGVLTPEDKSTD